MAEGFPQVTEWVAVSFVQGPLVEEIGEFLGRVVPVSRGVDAITKVLPLPWLQKLFKKTKEATEEQQRQDGKHVIKVNVAIGIVESWLNGLTGTAEELVDIFHEFIPAPGLEGKASLPDRIAQDIRDHALRSDKKKYRLYREPNTRGAHKGLASDRTRRKVGDHQKRISYTDIDYPAPLTEK
jgi:hypothetical protein